MNSNEIKKYIENQFVDDYEEIKSFMDSVNETLNDLDTSHKYESYNEFCLDVEESILSNVKNEDFQELSIKIIVDALNNMIKFKILEDENYEEKIKNYYDDPEKIIKDINKLKKKQNKSK